MIVKTQYLTILEFDISLFIIRINLTKEPFIFIDFAMFLFVCCNTVDSHIVMV